MPRVYIMYDLNDNEIDRDDNKTLAEKYNLKPIRITKSAYDACVVAKKYIFDLDEENYKCNRCGKIKSLEEDFYRPYGRGHITGWCIDCHALESKLYRERKKTGEETK